MCLDRYVIPGRVYSLGGGSTECVQGFLNREALETYGAVIDTHLRSHVQEQRLIPQLEFTCNGNITKWIIGGHRRPTPLGSAQPQLQVWRRLPTESAYNRIAYSEVTDLTLTDRPNVYEVVPSSPLMIQAGDILGYFQPSHEESGVLLYYLQEFDGPMNYRRVSNIPMESDFLLQINLIQDTDLPLVTVEIGKWIIYW